jgi:peptidyl-prolyl cis-trans isomerase SurA
MTLGRLSKTLLIMTGAMCAMTVHAQSAEDDQAGTTPAPETTSTTGLDLPKDITVFGSFDPKVRKATAIVNGDIITDTDVDQRLALVLLANEGAPIADEERDRLRLQVLRNLIDETLQIQEAKAAEVSVSQNEVDDAFTRVATNFKYTPTQFAAFIKSKGSSMNSLKRQIRGEMSWQRVLGRKVEPFVNVGDDEVKSVIARLDAQKGTQEYRVQEIFLSSTPDTDADILASANKIVSQIRAGGSFTAYARQFSEASTAAVGGDLGWVRAGQLPDALSTVVQGLSTGQTSDPIHIAGGYSIVQLRDKKQLLVADARDAVLSLKQIAIAFPKGMTQAQAAPRIDALAAATRNMAGCGKADEVGKSLGADVVANDSVQVRDLPPALQEMVLKLSIGQATPPFGSSADGVRVLVLCGRDDPVDAVKPSFDQIYTQLNQERINRRAMRYLRDLRRDAVVDYR